MAWKSGPAARASYASAFAATPMQGTLSPRESDPVPQLSELDSDERLLAPPGIQPPARRLIHAARASILLGGPERGLLEAPCAQRLERVPHQRPAHPESPDRRQRIEGVQLACVGRIAVGILCRATTAKATTWLSCSATRASTPSAAMSRSQRSGGVSSSARPRAGRKWV